MYTLAFTLSILALTSSLGLLLTFYRRLFVVFSFTNLSNDAILCAGSLETLERSIQRFVLSNTYFCHFIPSLCRKDRGSTPISTQSVRVVYHLPKWEDSYLFCCKHIIAGINLL